VVAVSELLIRTEREAWFTPDSLASYLQVSDRMIRKWVAEGRLRSYKLDGCRRFNPADVEEFVAQFRESGRAA
jgi:excisionase family DNA binding protein